jgi:hypothetical protein
MITNFRDLILEFGAYGSIVDLHSLSQQLEERLRHPAGVYATALSRVPESLEACEAPPAYCAFQHLRDVVLSDEFQLSIVPRLLHTFPEYRRHLFVHIPKCAGSDLRDVLSDRYFILDKTLGMPNQGSKWELFDTLHRFANAAKNGTLEFLLTGHFELREYISLNLIRPHDRVFAVVRDPVERVLSHVNYIVTVLKRDPMKSRPDSQYWCDSLGLETIDLPNCDGELAMRVLSHPKLKDEFHNVMCRWLGTCTGTFTDAVYGIKAASVEIVQVEEYTSWLWSKWGVKTKKLNSSEKLLAYSDLPTQLRTYVLNELVSEDLKLYEFLRR